METAKVLLKAKIETALIMAMAELRKPEGRDLLTCFDCASLWGHALEAQRLASQLCDLQNAEVNHG